MSEKAIIKIEKPTPIQRICQTNNKECKDEVYCLIIGHIDIWNNETTTSTVLCNHHLRMLRCLIDKHLDQTIDNEDEV